jgi:hypothetical protein
MFLLLLATAIGLEPDERQAQVEFLRLSYKANKDLFAFGTYHFQYTRGSSASLADAERGVFTKSIQERGLYIFDGKNARYELVPDPAELASSSVKVNERHTIRPAVAHRSLTDGEVTLQDWMTPDQSATAFHHAATVHRGTELFYSDGLFQFPLWLGRPGRRDYDLYGDLTRVSSGSALLVELDSDSVLD